MKCAFSKQGDIFCQELGFNKKPGNYISMLCKVLMQVNRKDYYRKLPMQKNAKRCKKAFSLVLKDFNVMFIAITFYSPFSYSLKRR